MSCLQSSHSTRWPHDSSSKRPFPSSLWETTRLRIPLLDAICPEFIGTVTAIKAPNHCPRKPRKSTRSWEGPFSHDFSHDLTWDQGDRADTRWIVEGSVLAVLASISYLLDLTGSSKFAFTRQGPQVQVLLRPPSFFRGGFSSPLAFWK